MMFALVTGVQTCALPIYRDRIADAAEVFDVRTVERGGAHAAPREVRGQVEPAPLPRHLPGLRLLVGQQQRLARGDEVDTVEVLHRGPGPRLHQAHGVASARNHAVVYGAPRRVPDPAQVPATGRGRVRETPGETH